VASIALSGVVAAGLVFGLGLGPFGPLMHPPFANLHGGYPAGLPSYGKSEGGNRAAGTFEQVARSADAPERILDFFEGAIDRTIWTVASRGRANIALVFRADPGVRGGLRTEPFERETYITLFVEDMQLPAGFPADFPIGHRANAIDGGLSDGIYHLRWDVGGNGSNAAFVDGFAQALEDAGWQVLTREVPRFGVNSLTCRSRTRPEISCRVVVEPDVSLHPSRVLEVANVWVGPGAETPR
jgi:hypothetical protein